MIFGFAGYLAGFFAPNPKAQDSVAVSLPAGMSIREAIKLISGNNDRTAVFVQCEDTFLSAKVELGTLTGSTHKALIETLQHRTIDLLEGVSYRVEDLGERGVYEIRCNK